MSGLMLREHYTLAQRKRTLKIGIIHKKYIFCVTLSHKLFNLYQFINI